VLAGIEFDASTVVFAVLLAIAVADVISLIAAGGATTDPLTPGKVIVVPSVPLNVIELLIVATLPDETVTPPYWEVQLLGVVGVEITEVSTAAVAAANVTTVEVFDD
jgi:hypothetical protein